MSRVRTRPTRDETRDKLFEAAAQVFAERGIGATSIEAIAAVAGFTRGAFYSNFASKDELIIAMLEDHVERSLRRHRELLALHRDPVDFVAALRAVDRSRQDPLGRSPLLHIELILFAARAERRRPELAKRLRARRELVREIVATTNLAAGRAAIDPDWAGSVLLALEDGFRLHRLIDPGTTPADSFLEAVSELQRVIGLAPKARSTLPPQRKARGEASLERTPAARGRSRGPRKAAHESVSSSKQT
jgi:AcrR family transcriptional regulator